MLATTRQMLPGRNRESVTNISKIKNCVSKLTKNEQTSVLTKLLDMRSHVLISKLTDEKIKQIKKNIK